MDVRKPDDPAHGRSGSDSDFTMVEMDSPTSEEPRMLSTELEDDIAQISLQNQDNVPRKDEYDVNFEDSREFAAYRWRDILKATEERMNRSDYRIASTFGDYQDLVREIQGKLTDVASNTSMKRQISKILSLPRTLASLTRVFQRLVDPLELKFDLLWGLIYLNLKYSYASPDRLRRTSDALGKIRSVVSLFLKIIEQLEDTSEALITLVEFIDPITIILTDSLEYLRTHSTDAKAEQAWPDLNDNITTNLTTLDGIVRHVSEMNSYTKVNQDRKIKNMSLRHALIPESDEPGSFPIRTLPFEPNSKFYGREEELNKMNEFLKPTGNQSLRTYTIFGRRGVGKTEIALQFANANESNFDAIFWIQCETAVVIRQSFTNVAIALNLPGAERDGRHEENLLLVQSWLKKTQKRWLLIFDNAEKDQILRAYWPIGSSGAILITSRKYHNFAKDMLRAGNTVKPFDPKQSWDLLLQLLGDDWKKLEEEGKLRPSEVTAAKNILTKLEGLALAIQQAAVLIKNPQIGGPTIAKTYDMFNEKIRTLPVRHSAPRSSTEKALDALWDMMFTSLSKNARMLLGVLSWLSPDSILLELFLPRNQKALNGGLEFCKQDPAGGNNQGLAPLSSLMNPTVPFDNAVNELLAKKLIKRDGRVLSIHRVVQEAVNFHDVDDLQQSFDLASRLVFEQFPKQVGDNSLYGEWTKCQNYIHHGVQLSKKYEEEYSKSDKITPSDYFLKLLSNCGWYLYENGEYDVSKRVLDTAASACDDRTSLLYAQILITSGSRFYDLNRLRECRAVWEVVLKIRQEKLSHDSPSIAAIYNNLGNLETASGNLEESQDYFERASMIWRAGGDASAFNLALTYLSWGRLHMLRGDLKEATRMTSLSESVFVRDIGSEQGVMVYVHFNYGNLQSLQKHWDLALRSYTSCLEIGKREFRLHPITAAAYYSIACIEFELGHAEVARAYLDKAKAIAELRSPTREDGPLARILWKTAVVLESDTYGKFTTEAADHRRRAEEARQNLLASGEGGLIPFIEEYEAERNEEEDSFDALVPLFFR